MSERAELVLALPSTSRTVTLHIEGESPRKYFSRDSRLTVRVNDETSVYPLSSDFSLNVPVSGAQHVHLETDQTYVPAGRSWRGSADRRHLGLRIFKCELR